LCYGTNFDLSNSGYVFPLTMYETVPFAMQYFSIRSLYVIPQARLLIKSCACFSVKDRR